MVINAQMVWFLGGLLVGLYLGSKKFRKAVGRMLKKRDDDELDDDDD